MIRYTFLILITLSLIAGACSGRKGNLEKSKLIPEKEFVSILTDIHLADGLLSLPKINAWFSSLDSISTYYQIIERHGYTKEKMDNTMKYYFVKNPKKLVKIYDEVLVILSEMELKVEKESVQEAAHVSNLWPGKDYYALPNILGDDSTMFDLTLYRSGIYTLSYSVTLFPDDQSINPGAVIYSCSPDSIVTGKKQYIKTPEYFKDGRLHSYNLIINATAKRILHLRGWLFYFENSPGSLEKHVKIENISITYSLVAV